MSFVFRPGPERIESLRCPGGVIVHVYGSDGRKILERPLAPGMARLAGRLAIDDALEAIRKLNPSEPMCIVIFDGDSGDRITPLGEGRWERGGEIIDERSLPDWN